MKIKYDGYRVQVHLNKGKKKVFTRNGGSTWLLALWVVSQALVGGR